MKDIRNFDLSAYNTFGINVHCNRFVEYDNIEELQGLVRSFAATDFPLLLLGGGSNLLFTDDFRGTVLHSAIKGIEVQDDGEYILVKVGSGEVWDDFVSLCITNGWYGAENLSHIPGEVGASAVQNIGAYGAEAKDIIYNVEAVGIATGELAEFSNEDCGYAYRHSKFKAEWRGKYIITHVTYRLAKQFIPCLEYGNLRSELNERGMVNPTAAQVRSVIIDIRNAKLPDPNVTGNAGSFFMNPIVGKDKFVELLKANPGMPHFIVDATHVKIPAGWLIEKCGWKGKSLGHAGVHPKQALVLVNLGAASGKEIVRLCKAIQEDVANKFGIPLVPEVNIL